MKKNYRWLAIVLAGIMTVGSPVPVLAEESVEVREEKQETVIPEKTEKDATDMEEEKTEKQSAEKEEKAPVKEKTSVEEKASAEDKTSAEEKVSVKESEEDGKTEKENFTFQYSGGTGKAKLSCDKVKETKDKVTAVIRISSKSYTHFYLGKTESSEDTLNLNDSKVYPVTVDSNGSYVEIPVTLGQDISLAGRTTAMSEPHWVNYTIRITKGNNSDTKPADPGTPDIPDPNDPTVEPDPKKPEVKPEPEHKTKKIADDGTYDVSKRIKYTGTMFRIVSCQLKSKDNKMTAIVTLSGQGYDRLSVNGKDYKSIGTGAGGGYQFQIPISALDTKITILARGTKSKKWFEKSITVPSKGIKWHTVTVKKEEESENKKKDPAKKVEKDVTTSEKKDKANTNGSTKAVKTSTTLADGTYKPDNFTWSGGTGRVRISCSQIIIKGGKASAKVTYSSGHYQYVKAGGKKINCSHSGKTSSAVIPIQLNANNKVIGMTTAMSVPHEIAYTMYFGLNAAGGQAAGNENDKTEAAAGIKNGGSDQMIDLTSKTLDEKAPLIPGLVFQSETEITYSGLIKIFCYEKGYTLIEIDANRGTDFEEVFREEGAQLKESVSEERQSESAEPNRDESVDLENADAQPEITIADQKEMVYQSGILRYLIVPEDQEIPAGLDKQVVVIQQPADKVFVDSEDSKETMEELQQEEKIGIVGTQETEIDYKQLIIKKINLMIESSKVLPRFTRSDLKPEEQKEAYEKMTRHAIQLEMAMVVDRSSDETNDLAKAEWMKVYGAIFGVEKNAQETYDVVVAKASAADKETALKELRESNEK